MMRANIEIDDKLMKDALRFTNAKTKREVAGMGLRTSVQLGKQFKVRKMRGKLHWDAVKAAVNFRALQALGFTIRKTIDTIIAAKCIEAGYALLHADRGFRPFQVLLGLKVAYSEI